MVFISKFKFFQVFEYFFISSVKSKKVYSLKPVWLDKIAVGNGQHCTFKADNMGIATVREHFPIPDKSFMAATFFNIYKPPF
ncbi:hypothetical protein SDC9_147328 [bioreactor metagenome]|uniref:Uncharacterized protein n=1 Tax=bioreactor metagenome TaxID=1076179 RepID=A0A645EH98_9ZZZZ